MNKDNKKYRVCVVHKALWNCSGDCYIELEDSLNEGWIIDQINEGKNGSIYILKRDQA